MSTRPSWRQLDLEALDHNVGEVRRASGRADLLAVVKADAYGHDAVTVARRLQGNEAVHGLVVVGLDEALALRSAGVRGRVLVLCGGVSPSREALSALSAAGATPVLSSREQVDWASGLRWPDGVHLLVDTGMARLGVAADELERCVSRLAEAQVTLRGVATHFVESEKEASAVTRVQLERFARAAAQVWSRFPQARVHVANSAAALHWLEEAPSADADLAAALRDPQRVLVRPGGALYGVDLSDYVEDRRRHPSTLRPVLSMGCEIVQRRALPAGATVGYGGLWTARRDSEIALLPLGYADGVPGQLTDGASVLIGGVRAPVVGAVSMDLLTVDVTDVADSASKSGEVAWLLSRQGPSLAEWVSWSGRKPYELLCGWSRRVPLRAG